MTLLKNEGPHAIFDKKEKTTFMIVTDENHTNMPCLSGHRSRQVVPTDNSFVVFAANKYRHLSYSYTLISDGESRENIPKDGTLRFTNKTEKIYGVALPEREGDCFFDGVDMCTPEEKPCSPEHIKFLRDVYATDHFSHARISDNDAELNCKIQTRDATENYAGSFGSRGRKIRITDASQRDQALENLWNDCSSITDFEALDYSDPNDFQSELVWRKPASANLLEYLKEFNERAYQGQGYELSYLGKCSYNPFNASQTLMGDGEKSWTNGITYIDKISDLGELKENIETEAGDLLGEGNYTVVAIANLGEGNPSTCTAKVSNRSSDIIDIADKYISICDESYSSALTWFDDFVSSVPESEYDLTDLSFNLKDTVKSILGIKLSYHGNSLDKSEYTFKNGVLTFTNPEILRFIGGETFEIKYKTIETE